MRETPKVTQEDILSGDIMKLTNALAQHTSKEKNFFRGCETWRQTDTELKAVKSFKVHLDKVLCCRFAQYDSDILITTGSDKKLKLWDAFHQTLLKEINVDHSWPLTCNLSSSGAFACTGNLKGSCSLFDMSKEKSSHTKPINLYGHKEFISSVEFIRDSQIITGSLDSTLRLWDINTQKSTQTFAEHETGVLCLDMQKSCACFISGSSDTFAKVWDIRTNKAELNFSGNESDINAIRYFPDQNSFCTGSDDTTCRLFDIRSHRQLNVYKNNSILSAAHSIAFSKSGHYLYSIYDNGDFVIWDTLSGAIREKKQSKHRYTCVDVPPDGSVVATCGWDSFVNIWSSDLKKTKSAVVSQDCFEKFGH